jgi:uncharacterized protein YndB with AHSA1/START domain
MSDTDRKVSASRVIAAPPERIFDVLADPAQHREIDGSGSVQGVRGGAPARLSLGARFGMNMRIGVPYLISNEVVEFEEGRRIGWRHLMRHVWRYELEPVDVDGVPSTRVTETFDWGPAPGGALYPLLGFPRSNLRAIEATLERLDRYVTS